MTPSKKYIHLETKDRKYLEKKRWKKIFLGNWNKMRLKNVVYWLTYALMEQLVYQWTFFERTSYTVYYIYIYYLIGMVIIFFALKNFTFYSRCIKWKLLQVSLFSLLSFIWLKRTIILCLVERNSRYRELINLLE